MNIQLILTGKIEAPAIVKLLADTLVGTPSFMNIDEFSIENQANPVEIA